MLLEPAKKSKPLISLTPLIDVVFILLLFFMLTSSFSRIKQFEINSTTTTGQPTQAKGVTKLLLLDAQNLEINGERFKRGTSEFTNQLEQLARENEFVNIAAIDSVEVGALIDLIDQLSTAGIANLNLSESISP